jgi:DNA anti-recombination protein RmuC
MSKDIDEKVDKLEEAVDPNTVISVGGYSFTPAKLMIAGAIVSSTLGALYGAFEVYKDYMDMKAAIQQYVTPDLSEIHQKLAVLEESSAKSVEYTRDINNNLKSDIRRIEGVLDTVERGVRQSQRDVDNTVKELNAEMNRISRENSNELNRFTRQTETELRNIRNEVDSKIKKALDNPLAN